MDKYMEVFCEQNPDFELECEGCGHSNKFKSKEVFGRKIFTFTCKKCGKTTDFNTTSFSESFCQQMKDAGITVS